MKKMADFVAERADFEGKRRGPASNVKEIRKHERFGETIRYMTLEEWQRFLDSIEKYEHKLMMRLIYELGCRVGEFVRIRLRDVDFGRGRVFFPRENTKTGRRRVSYLPTGLANELKSWLRQAGRMGIRSGVARRPAEFLFSPVSNNQEHYSENRIRQVFRQYATKAGLDRAYGVDDQGRVLHELTVHSLRHSHIMHYIHIHRLPIAVVQKQVGHTSLKTTSVYLNPSEEALAEAYRSVKPKVAAHHHKA
ncbi:MAG: site-specific integrase [Candidatus Hydrogenedentes bacterium]|nr:site-specific integrase [Candidatus Hydrogenedentota bacterium]